MSRTQSHRRNTCRDITYEVLEPRIALSSTGVAGTVQAAALTPSTGHGVAAALQTTSTPITVGLSSASNPYNNNTVVTSSIQVVGKAAANSTVILGIVGVGPTQSTKANSAGAYAFTVPVSVGKTTIAVQQSSPASSALAELTVNRIVTTPPTVHITSTTSSGGGGTSGNITVYGNVAAGSSSVKTLYVQVDSSPLVPISFGANGAFSYTTTLPPTSAAEGNHVVRFIATDTAGVNSTAVPVDFSIPAPQTIVGPPNVSKGPSGTLATNVFMLNISYSQPMSASAFNAANYTLTQTIGGSAGTQSFPVYKVVQVDPQTAVVWLYVPLLNGKYSLNVSPSVTDQAGVALTGNTSFSFTVAPTATV